MNGPCDTGCGQPAIHDTRRCLQHQEPVPRRERWREATPAEPSTRGANATFTILDETAHFTGQPVGFDEQPARGWLDRALERLFG